MRHFLFLLAMACVLAIASIATVLPPTAATAHPFGPPPLLSVDVQGTTVRMAWSVPEDDLTALSGALGLVESSQTFVYSPDGTLESGPASMTDQLAALAGTAPLEDYVEEHVAATSDGRACTIGGDSSMMPDGVLITARCPSAPQQLGLEVTLLHDLHPAYRTVATVVSTGQRVVFTAEDPSETLDLSTTATTTGRRPWAVAMLLPVLMIGAGLAIWRHQHTTSTA